jgi:hypothetical protein
MIVLSIMMAAVRPLAGGVAVDLAWRPRMNSRGSRRRASRRRRLPAFDDAVGCVVRRDISDTKIQRRLMPEQCVSGETLDAVMDDQR